MPKALIVDDNKPNLVALKMLLRKLNCQVAQAESGEEALKLAEKEEYFAIISDVQMPNMSGFELVVELRKLEICKNTPILLVTGGEFDASQIEGAFKTGAIDYIKKPIDPVLLISKAGFFLQLYNQRIALDEANKELTKVNGELDRFTRAVTHELMTPISAMSMSADIMKSEDEDNEIINILKESIKDLEALIRDMLEYARAGGKIAKQKSLNIKAIFDQAVSASKTNTEEKELDVSYDLKIDTVLADETSLKQVFINLLNNSIKYKSQERSLKITLSSEKEGEEIKIIYRDNGMGIKKEDLEKIFGEYERVHDIENLKVSGLGLGLATVQKFIQANHGQINVESEYGKNTEFTFILPAGE